ncbi:hypothetical protein EVAR_44726_1 [Eumeta japonica]|uniref:Uncharacterized protein n=1 Tax=Eumeta variegata TaxID=151549 RepID=A0A4C1XJN2_EUMVA|nr:hypothetical protein EVAR_44726_1 [Eumeta japonica]
MKSPFILQPSCHTTELEGSSSTVSHLVAAAAAIGRSPTRAGRSPRACRSQSAAAPIKRLPVCVYNFIERSISQPAAGARAAAGSACERRFEYFYLVLSQILMAFRALRALSAPLFSFGGSICMRPGRMFRHTREVQRAGRWSPALDEKESLIATKALICNGNSQDANVLSRPFKSKRFIEDLTDVNAGYRTWGVMHPQRVTSLAIPNLTAAGRPCKNSPKERAPHPNQAPAALLRRYVNFVQRHYPYKDLV